MNLFLWATIISSVLAAPAPTQDGSADAPIDLTMETFSNQVSQGVWWIKFFSPYCHHCKAFAPTWTKLYDEYKGSVKFGNVNCVSQGDLCGQENVMAYPAIHLYKDAKLVDSQKSSGQQYFKKYIEEKLKELDPDAKVEGGDKTEEKKDEEKKEATKGFPKFPASTATVNEKFPGLEDTLKKDKTDSDENASGPNPKGISEELDHKEFNRRVTATRDSWFVQFYSPSSSYSRDIQPAWNQMAVKARGHLNIAQVNCDVEKQLCKEAGVHEMPTLKYFASSIQSEYLGLRGLGDLLQFLDRAVGARNPKEITLANYKELVKPTDNIDDDVTFVYLYDKATSSEDFQALEKLAVAIVGTVNIVKSKDVALVQALGAERLPALYAVSANKKVVYPAQAPNEIRDHGRLVSWAKENRVPLVPQLTPFNSKDLFSPKMVVLAILDPRDESDTRAAIKELKATARELQQIMEKQELEEIEELRKKKQLKIEEAKDKGDKKAEEAANHIRVELTERQRIGIAWIDGVFWERWVKSRYGSNEGYVSRVVINEESAGRYWDRNWGHGILLPSRSQILETISEIGSTNPRVRSVALQGQVGRIMTYGRNYALEHQMLVVLCIAGVVFAGMYFRRRLRIAGGGSSSEGLLDKLD